MKAFEAIVILPILTGTLLLIFPRSLQVAKTWIAWLTTATVLWYSIMLYNGALTLSPEISVLTYELSGALWRSDALARLIVLFIGLFSFLLMLYNLVYTRDTYELRNFNALLLVTFGFSNAAVLSNHLLIFLFSWSMLALTLYLLIPSHDKDSAKAANKSLIIIGASDVFLLLGIIVIWREQQSWLMNEIQLSPETLITHFALFSLLVGSFTKAGAFPFHTWIPDFTKEAPASSSAYLPASLDKLLGIYFLTRICYQLFIPSPGWRLAIISVGALTIIIGVMMALIQHDMKRLLGYHAVSQVGYMILGLGLGTLLGLLGGLFHMINNALYKSGLFMVAGNVKDKTGQNDLGRLGGLSGHMPVTFIAALVFALSISGIPPFNGFASKWIIYQAIIDFGKTPGLANDWWILWLSLAVIGSALTLASFLKFISGIFLGRQQKVFDAVRESHPVKLIAISFLAIICVLFGVFSNYLVVPELFGSILGNISYVGIWSSYPVALLIVASVIIGLLVYGAGHVGQFRREDSFVGGERLQDKTGFEVIHFYDTVKDSNAFSRIYNQAQQNRFDLFHLSKDGILKITNLLRVIHTGILHTYALWLILGLLAIILIFILT
jgi:formate hydrogenlyase subunit 3/multisubunit Na+/H+ antiporter MnhD subunit